MIFWWSAKISNFWLFFFFSKIFQKSSKMNFFYNMARNVWFYHKIVKNMFFGVFRTQRLHIVVYNNFYLFIWYSDDRVKISNFHEKCIFLQFFSKSFRKCKLPHILNYFSLVCIWPLWQSVWSVFRSQFLTCFFLRTNKSTVNNQLCNFFVHCWNLVLQ